MSVLATRRLSYTADNGEKEEVVLSISMPMKEDDERWVGRFAFDPPVFRRELVPSGRDFFDTFVEAVTLAFILFRASELYGRASWQGMQDCGLPVHTEDPPPTYEGATPPQEVIVGPLDILGTRKLFLPDERGAAREFLLTVFAPFKEGETWKCGFTFDPPLDGGVRYALGEDLIESLLGALAMARSIYERAVPKDWDSIERFGCHDFPYRIGRSFRHDPAPDVPGMPDFVG